MEKNWNLIVAITIGGLAIHGAIVACGDVSGHSADAQAADVQTADVPMQPVDGPAQAQLGVPPGTIIAFGGAVAPEGWLVCDGSTVSRATYASLFNAIRINFGSGDGIENFNLPDLRGRFLRGTDNGAGRDPDVAGRTASNDGGSIGDAVGSLQSDQFASHRHALTDPGHSHIMATTNGIPGAVETPSPTSSGFDYVSGGATPTVSVSTTGITEAATGGSETRPQNVAINYIIKT
jgi:microcystin-dependent protein